MLFDIRNDRIGNKIPDTHSLSAQKPDFRATDIILDDMRNHMDTCVGMFQLNDALAKTHSHTFQ